MKQLDSKDKRMISDTAKTLEKGISVVVTILPLDDETSESFPGLITSKP